VMRGALSEFDDLTVLRMLNGPYSILAETADISHGGVKVRAGSEASSHEGRVGSRACLDSARK